MSSKRPEHQAPPEVYYGVDEARKYTQNSRIIEVQEKCTQRALELLALPDDTPSLLLDLGCGSGLSGETISEQGHMWVGMDISPSMLDVAIEREVDGDIILADIGSGVPFRSAMFDGAISISAVQWLCYADTTSHKPAKRLYRLFMTLFASMSRGSRAVFQFYPENDAQVELIVSQAMRSGFTGGLVVDFPNSSRAKKIYLVLMTGGGTLPRGLQDENDSGSLQAQYQRRERMKHMRSGKQPKLAWIMQKKERRRKQGKETRRDSKFTGRKRRDRF